MANPRALFNKYCAVTGYDLKIKVNTDGRQRGLWIEIGDAGTPRRNANQAFVERSLEDWHQAKLAGRLIGEASVVGDMVRRLSESEAGLLEWDAVKELRDKLTKALAKRPKDE